MDPDCRGAAEHPAPSGEPEPVPGVPSFRFPRRAGRPRGSRERHLPGLPSGRRRLQPPARRRGNERAARCSRDPGRPRRRRRPRGRRDAEAAAADAAPMRRRADPGSTTATDGDSRPSGGPPRRSAHAGRPRRCRVATVGSHGVPPDHAGRGDSTCTGCHRARQLPSSDRRHSSPTRILDSSASAGDPAHAGRPRAVFACHCRARRRLGGSRRPRQLDLHRLPPRSGGVVRERRQFGAASSRPAGDPARAGRLRSARCHRRARRR